MRRRVSQLSLFPLRCSQAKDQAFFSKVPAHAGSPIPEKTTNPTWHLDGRRLLFVSQRSGKFDLYLMEVGDGGGIGFIVAGEERKSPRG
jgi:hypothetical protein